MNNKLIQASLAELVGTFILVFVGGFAVASGQGVVTAALAPVDSFWCKIFIR